MDKNDGSGNNGSAENLNRPPSEASTLDFNQPDALIGQRLDGRFFIERNLTDTGADAGGIGLVYLAKDVKLMDKRVVVKILREDALKHGDIVRKFMHEKEALIRLDHPGIVRILDSGNLTDGNPFMVMDYIEGGSLRKILRDKRQLPLDYVAHVIESVTDALGAAHSEEILHRDIKPENIMLTPRDDGFDRVRLIDFGIARVGGSKLAPVTEVGRLVGTVIYIAPEQLICNLDLRPAVDVYSMGLVAYEMITGELPFKPRAIAEMYQLQKEGVKVWPGELRADLPRVAETILMAALDFEAKKRPQNIRAWGRGLAKELRNDNTLATQRFYAEYSTGFANSMTEITIPPDSSEFLTQTRIEVPDVDYKPSRGFKWLIPSAIGVVLLSIVAGLAAWKFLGAQNAVDSPVTNVPPDMRPDRQLSFSLMVQKWRDGRKYDAPFRSSGNINFESGWKFTMNFESDTDGYIYVFNEDKDAQNKVFYNLIFPTPTINKGSSQISTGKPIETAQSTFRRGLGTEVNWVIWSKDKNDDLEAVVRSAVPTPYPTILNALSVTLLQNFIQKYRDESRDVDPKSPDQRRIIKSKGDIIVDRFELEHH